MDGPPQTYESTYETRVVSHTSNFNVAFLRSLHGILKLSEIILSCVVLICVACTNYWSYASSGQWVNFVAAFTLIISALLFIFSLFNLITRFPGMWVTIEFSVLVLSTVLWFIACVVSATVHYYGGGAIGSAVFSACAFIVYVVELVVRARITRGSGAVTITMTGVSTSDGTRSHPIVTPTDKPTVQTPGSYEARLELTDHYSRRNQPEEGYVMP